MTAVLVRPARGPLRYSSSIWCSRPGVFFADVQDEQHRLLRKELESANQLFFVRRQLQGAQRDVLFERGFAAFEQREFAIQLRALDLLAIFLQALHALFDHHQVAQNQLDLHVFQIAHRIHRAFFMRHGVALKQPQDVRQRVRHAHAGKITGVAQSFLGDGRESRDTRPWRA